MFLSAFHIEPVTAIGTITINADGSIDPPTGSVSTNNNVTYTLTSNVTVDATGIVILRKNIVVDGNGFTLHGSGNGAGNGIDVYAIDNVTVRNIQVEAFYDGIWLSSCSNFRITGNNITHNINYGVGFYWSAAISVSGNNITDNGDGIWFGRGMYISISDNIIARNNGTGIELFSSAANSLIGNAIRDNSGNGILIGTSSSNNVSRNTLTNNGLYLDVSPGNRFYYNNFIDGCVIYTKDSANIWDDGYPSGGNYWDENASTDECNGPYQNLTGNDGIWDQVYVIDENNVDRYPFTEPWGTNSYYVTVKAHCITECLDLNVNIDIDGSTGYTTPQTITDLRGAHTFTVPKTDANGHPFRQWSTGQTTTTITTCINGTFTAIYDLMFNLTIIASNGGTTSPALGSYLCWSDTEVTVTASPSIDYRFDYWELDSLNVGFTTQYSVLMNNNHTLKAVFRIIGDCNSDGMIDILDLVIVGTAFGSTPGHPRWINAADEHRDNVIDVLDLVCVAAHFGYPN